eukprot:m.28228 g.28228  ORF g.28228 m.28228 type:complete len:601 (+) comp4499_c0_seq1:111-1913(+)
MSVCSPRHPLSSQQHQKSLVSTCAMSCSLLLVAVMSTVTAGHTLRQHGRVGRSGTSDTVVHTHTVDPADPDPAPTQLTSGVPHTVTAKAFDRPLFYIQSDTLAYYGANITVTLLTHNASADELQVWGAVGTDASVRNNPFSFTLGNAFTKPPDPPNPLVDFFNVSLVPRGTKITVQVWAESYNDDVTFTVEATLIPLDASITVHDPTPQQTTGNILTTSVDGLIVVQKMSSDESAHGSSGYTPGNVTWYSLQGDVVHVTPFNSWRTLDQSSRVMLLEGRQQSVVDAVCGDKAASDAQCAVLGDHQECIMAVHVDTRKTLWCLRRTSYAWAFGYNDRIALSVVGRVDQNGYPPEELTLFDLATGKELHTIKSNISDTGDFSCSAGGSFFAIDAAGFASIGAQCQGYNFLHVFATHKNHLVQTVCRRTSSWDGFGGARVSSVAKISCIERGNANPALCGLAAEDFKVMKYEGADMPIFQGTGDSAMSVYMSPGGGYIFGKNWDFTESKWTLKIDILGSRLRVVGDVGTVSDVGRYAALDTTTGRVRVMANTNERFCRLSANCAIVRQAWPLGPDRMLVVFNPGHTLAGRTVWLSVSLPSTGA